MAGELYYTVADLQYRRWLISLCIGEKGHHICCLLREGRKPECGCVTEFKLAAAFLDILTDYQSLACLIHTDPSISPEELQAANCISEAELDKILDWLENYCGECFIAKGNAPSAEGTPCSELKLKNIIEIVPECCIALEDAGLLLVEDTAGEDCIELETTTCLLAQDDAAWEAYIGGFSAITFGP